MLIELKYQIFSKTVQETFFLILKTLAIQIHKI